MQKYTEIPSSTTLEASLPLLLNNDKTGISCNAGTFFPSTGLREGMLCYRTDLKKLYQLKDEMSKSWVVIADLNGNFHHLDGGSGKAIKYDKQNLNSWDNMPTGFYAGRNMTGQPPGDIDWRIIQIRGESSDGYSSQLAFSSNNGKLWTRLQKGGAWTEWKEIYSGRNGEKVEGLNADQVDGYHVGHGYGQIPISNGNLNSNLNADQVDGYHVGHGYGQIPVSDGTVNTGLNADQVDGYSPGNQSGAIAINNGSLNHNLNAEMVGGVRVENLLQVSGSGGVDRWIESLSVGNLGSNNATLNNAVVTVGSVQTLNATSVNVSNLNHTKYYSGSKITSSTASYSYNQKGISVSEGPAIGAGNYDITALLQKLVDCSHTHFFRDWACACQCDGGDDNG